MARPVAIVAGPLSTLIRAFGSTVTRLLAVVAQHIVTAFRGMMASLSAIETHSRRHFESTNKGINSLK